MPGILPDIASFTIHILISYINPIPHFRYRDPFRI